MAPKSFLAEGKCGWVPAGRAPPNNQIRSDKFWQEFMNNAVSTISVKVSGYGESIGQFNDIC